jgi:hypothetical protein
MEHIITIKTNMGLFSFSAGQQILLMENIAHGRFLSIVKYTGDNQYDKTLKWIPKNTPESEIEAMIEKICVAIENGEKVVQI